MASKQPKVTLFLAQNPQANSENPGFHPERILFAYPEKVFPEEN